ncbi:MAG: amidohydrolase family protein [Candidatus Thermoplasmatota archaeon]
MTTYGPWIFLRDEVVEGGLVVEDGKIAEVLDTPPGAVDVHGLVLPLMANPHTHLGDAFIRDVPPGTIEEIVAPPHGFKFRMLARASRAEILTGMKHALERMASQGTALLADFREGGLDGIALLKEALRPLEISGLVLGRPSSLIFDEIELTKILSAADGIGLSSISEWGWNDIAAIAEMTHRTGKLFALHVSEGRRETIEDVLSLRPSFVIHMVHATEGDIRGCADAGVPIVVCPRSNRFFGMRPSIEQMLANDALVALGTDNAMLSTPLLWDEMRFVASEFPALSLEDVLRLGIANPWKVLNQEGRIGWMTGMRAAFLFVPQGEMIGLDALRSSPALITPTTEG